MVGSVLLKRIMYHKILRTTDLEQFINFLLYSNYNPITMASTYGSSITNNNFVVISCIISKNNNFFKYTSILLVGRIFFIHRHNQFNFSFVRL